MSAQQSRILSSRILVVGVLAGGLGAVLAKLGLGILGFYLAAPLTAPLAPWVLGARSGNSGPARQPTDLLAILKRGLSGRRPPKSSVLSAAQRQAADLGDRRLAYDWTVLHQALRVHHRLALRGEALGNLTDDLFVDQHHLDRLSSREWQIVVGQRGSGKTALLLALENRLKRDDRHIALRITMAEGQNAAAGLGLRPDEQLASLHFETLFGQFYRGLRFVVSESDQQKLFSREASIGLGDRQKSALPLSQVTADARSSIASLTSDLAIDRINLLIDDWGALDPATRSHTAWILRETFAGLPQISLKLAADPETVALGELSTSLGLRHTLAGLDLDRSSLTLSERSDFFGRMLWLRLLASDSQLAGQFGDVDAPSALLGVLFADEQVFRALVRGAGATPRAFLATFRILTATRRWSADVPWSSDDVSNAVRAHALAASAFETGSSMFCVSRSSHGALAESIRHLHMLRLVSEIDGPALDQRISDEFFIYRFSSGRWREIAGERGSRAQPSDTVEPITIETCRALDIAELVRSKGDF
jgi:hypothetical protein